MKKRPTILVMTGYYLPGYKAGGPVKSVANIVENLHADFNFTILAADRDLGDNTPYPGVETNVWRKVGNAVVKYLEPNRRGIASIWREIEYSQADLLYLNSFFGSWFSVYPLLGLRIGTVKKMPVLIAPRGEFSKGALSLKSIKKRIYLEMAKSLGLFRTVSWQASSEFEKQDIIRETGVHASSVHVASDLASPLSTNILKGTRDHDDCLHVLFLSRISPKKNLDFALDVLRNVSATVAVNIYGPTEDSNYWSHCQEKINALPGNITVRYHGEVRPDAVCDIMRDNDLFFLPTMGENFGHVISEALSVGTRVLISDQTPWRDLSKFGFGDEFPLSDQGAFVARVEGLARQSPGQRMQDRVARHSTFQRINSSSQDKVRNKDMFTAVLLGARAREIGEAE